MRPIHQMRLTGKLGSGADEWSCPECGRRIALFRPPDAELTVLDPGDDNAVHVGVLEPDAAAEAAERYGVGPVQEIPRPPRAPSRAGEPVPEPDADDRRWLAEIGIDWDGGAAA